jgi:hypothetical protein
MTPITDEHFSRLIADSEKSTNNWFLDIALSLFGDRATYDYREHMLWVGERLIYKDNDDLNLNFRRLLWDIDTFIEYQLTDFLVRCGKYKQTFKKEDLPTAANFIGVEMYITPYIRTTTPQVEGEIEAVRGFCFREVGGQFYIPEGASTEYSRAQREPQ